MTTLVHLVYIHGFQGDDTSFQSFPLHLQEKLASRIPSELDIRFQSSLYPTYKSVKPISHATKNFLAWLKTQPDGPVILVGHSMGGLLAADAATDPSNIDELGKPKRIVGVIAFDVPFLGMHPHVVVSGIASLLPKDDGKKKKSEKEMNKHPQIQIVDPKATDEWEEFKRRAHRPLSSEFGSSQLAVPHNPTSPSTLSLPEPSSPHSKDTPRSRSPSPGFFNKTIDKIAARAKENDPLVRWLRKHADAPFSAGKRWIVERFQFGSSMFDPYDLGDRYDRLVQWNGLWVNYWTYTRPEKKGKSKSPSPTREADPPNEADELDNDIAVLDSGLVDSKSEANTRGKRNMLKKSRQNDLEKSEALVSMRHFIVLPTGMGRVLGGSEHWERVPIAGVDDEVAAHTGIFIPTQNVDYAMFVERVADKVFDWCGNLYGQRKG
ncbi:hypothetical protein D9611_008503 [Ephemerocybe angulata]|uniref:AB hydrolase-1 domain-containing protein n=1 Tax=Ephemerocybe angulata TaxID=980116 RepID=A0A8H5EV38_9AGAR|nr:hypothetical protein D9611_008503 [Tulosesus angulatus]